LCPTILIHPDHWAYEVSVFHLLEDGASGLRRCGSPIEMDDSNLVWPKSGAIHRQATVSGIFAGYQSSGTG
jgi:hypothetical protein